MDTVQKMKFSTKEFCSKCDQIRSFLQIWSHLLKKSLMEKLHFFAVGVLILAMAIFKGINKINEINVFKIFLIGVVKNKCGHFGHETLNQLYLKNEPIN